MADQKPNNYRYLTSNSASGYISPYASNGIALPAEEYGARLRRAYQPRYTFRPPSPPLPSGGPFIEYSASDSAKRPKSPKLLSWAELNPKESIGSRHCSTCGAVGHYRSTCRDRQSTDQKGGTTPYGASG